MRKEEMETILRYDSLEDKWFAFSSVPKHITAMKCKGWNLVKEGEDFAEFIAPPYSVRLFDAENKRVTRLSEEERAELGKRLTAARQLKNQRE